jgi:hypothetical protein
MVKTTKKTGILTKKLKSLDSPDIDSMFDSSGLPGLPPIAATDTEQIANREVVDMMTMIKENRKNNAERFRDIEAGEFWFCVCFQSRSQKEDFVKMLLERYPGHDNFGDKYVSGLELAEMLDIPVTPIILGVKKSRLAPKSLRETEVIKNA